MKMVPLKYLDYHYVNFPTITDTITDGVCITWQVYKQGIHYLDKFRTIMTQSDAAAQARGLLQAPLNRQKMLIVFGIVQELSWSFPFNKQGEERAASWCFTGHHTSS
jgi:hypothetical protein